nr:9583_t:CDS:2 [Entrophospora candida]
MKQVIVGVPWFDKIWNNSLSKRRHQIKSYQQFYNNNHHFELDTIEIPHNSINKLIDELIGFIKFVELQFELYELFLPYPQLYILCKISTFELPKTKFDFSSLNDAMKSFIRLCVLMDQNFYNIGQALNKEQEGDFICKSPMKR